MGASHLQHILPLNSKSMVLENKGTMPLPKTSSNSNGAHWSKVLIAQSMRRKRNQRIIKNGGHGISSSSTTRILMKRRALLKGSRSRRPINGKVKTLKKLVPNGEAVGLDGLFRETADYIMSLEMKVKVMQAMVNILSDCNMI